MKETLTLDPKRRTTWRNRKEKKTGRGAREYGKLNNVILDSFRVKEAESFPSRNTLQTKWAGGAGERLPAGSGFGSQIHRGPCEVGSMAESSKGESIGLKGHLAEDSAAYSHICRGKKE